MLRQRDEAVGAPVAVTAVMSNRRELQAYEYVNRPYDVVREALLADPAALLGKDVDLRAIAGPFSIGAKVAIDIVGIDGRTDFTPTTRLTIEWKAAQRPGLFPTMRGILSLYPLTPTETQLDFMGTYDPPLGVLGDAVDAVAMHGIAKQSVDGFVRDLAAALR
jgi:hypothetical protein